MPERSQSGRPLAITCDFDPMPFEVDFTGYLSNTVVVHWMEVLRVQMMRMHFAEIDTGARESLSVIARTEIDYISAIQYGEQISGTAWVEAASVLIFSLSPESVALLRHDRMGHFSALFLFDPYTSLKSSERGLAG